MSLHILPTSLRGNNYYFGGGQRNSSVGEDVCLQGLWPEFKRQVLERTSSLKLSSDWHMLAAAVVHPLLHINKCTHINTCNTTNNEHSSSVWQPVISKVLANAAYLFVWVVLNRMNFKLQMSRGEKNIMWHLKIWNSNMIIHELKLCWTVVVPHWHSAGDLQSLGFQ